MSKIFGSGDSYAATDSPLGGVTYLEGDRDYIIHDIVQLPSYELNGKSMRINDTVWGEAYIGNEPYDDLLMQLARSPLFRRLQAVEQLTLPAQYSTLPNTSNFSRWQHIWGSLVFVRKMTEGDERFSERDRIILQLRTLFSDVGQTAFSHMGDWIFQEGKITEDLHDQELASLLKAFEIDKLLNGYGIKLSEVVFPPIADWVECPAPNICVDRVDYGLREILLWMKQSPIHLYRNALHNPKSLFTINADNMLEITDAEFAQHFSVAYNLLPTEHWGQPVHKLQLQLMQTAVKRALLRPYDFYSLNLYPEYLHPRDLMYSIDTDFSLPFNDWEGVGISDLMKDIGLASRRSYVNARQFDIGDFLLKGPNHFLDPMKPYTWQSGKYGIFPWMVGVETDRRRVSSVSLGDAALEFVLPGLKPRTIDPLVAHPTEPSRPYSEIKPGYKRFIREQLIHMDKSHKVSLGMGSVAAQQLLSLVNETNEQWVRHLHESRNKRSPEGLVELIRWAAMRAAPRCFDIISDW